MGVYRDDYLMLGAKVDPDEVNYEQYEAELTGEDTRRFDIVFDGMSGEYAVAGKIISVTGQFDDPDHQFIEITHEMMQGDPGLLRRVQAEFPDVEKLSILMFRHYH